MKKLSLLISSLLISLSLSAQTAEEVVNQYLTKIGGVEKLSELKSVKMVSTVRAQGMEMPAELVKKVPNKMKMTLSFQGYEIVQPAFNGEEGWSTNFMSMENEKMDVDAAAAIKSEAQDFPDVFYNYKDKGYVLSLLPEEEIEGKTYYVINVHKNPIILKGEEIKNEAIFYFDKETSLLSFRKSTAESGPTKGMEMESVFKDYKEVEGVMFPYVIEQKVNGMVQASIQVEAIEYNAEIEDSTFEFPE